jgi:hypothetical protein
VTLNDASTVARHRHFAGITQTGTIRLNDEASVRGNDDFYGVFIDTGGELIMNGSSSIVNNGGGIANEGTVTLNDSASVHGNHARRGGGVFNGTGCALVISGSSVVRANVAEIAGGGIFNLGDRHVEWLGHRTWEQVERPRRRHHEQDDLDRER